MNHANRFLGRCRHAWRPMLAGAGLAALLGCQAVFTYSPFEFLARDPDNLTPAQKVTYAEEALASGDTTAMNAAYTTVEGAIASASAEEQPRLNLLAAQLATEISGVPALLTAVLSPGGVSLDAVSGSGSVEEFLATSGVDVSMMIEAAGHFVAAEEGGAPLSATEYVMGSVGLLLLAAQEAGDGTEGNVEALGTPETWSAEATATAAEAVTFLQTGIDNLEEGDPTKDLLTQVSSYLSLYTTP